MEDGLWHAVYEIGNITRPSVLILVLMEDGLWLYLRNKAEKKYKNVLILVLMEDGLWQTNIPII